MSRPTPYIRCPTKVSMDTAIRALWAAGYRCGGYDLNGLMACVPLDINCARYPIVWYAEPNIGISDPGRIAAGDWTRCNSPAHLISYLRKPVRRP